jgi:hypothetical protein
MQRLVGLLVRPEGRKGLPRSEIASETAFRPFFVTVEIAQQTAGHKVRRQPGFTICLIPDKPRFSLVFYALGPGRRT